MLKRLLFVAAILAGCVSVALAQGTTKPKSSLTSEVSQQFPDNISGAITPAAARQVTNDFVASFQQAPQVNAQTGTSYTFLSTDYGNLVTFNNASAVAVTLPQATGSFFPWNAYVENKGAGTVTITPGGGSTINGASSFTVTTNGFVWVVSDGTNYQIWQGLPGNGLVTNSMLASMTAPSVKGVITTGAPADLTMTQLLGQFAITGAGNLYGAQGSFWTGTTDADGAANARIHAFRDRVFIDDGVLCSGAAGTSPSFCLSSSRSGTAINSVGAGFAGNAASLWAINSWGAIGIVGQTVTSSANRSGNPVGPSSSSAGIGVAGMALNDLTGTPYNSWGGYFETLRKTAGVGTALGVEIDVGNVGAIVDITPFAFPSPTTGATAGLWDGCGGSAGAFVTYTNCSAAIAILPNTAKWRKGILFHATGLDPTVGAGGAGVAMDMARSQSIRWLNSTPGTDAEIWADAAGIHGSSRQIMPITSQSGTLAQATTAFMGLPTGLCTAATCPNGAEAAIQSVAPVAGTFRNLTILSSAPAAGQTLTVTFRINNASTALTCTVTGTGTTCTDSTHTAAITAGQTYDLQFVTSATTGTLNNIVGGVEFDVQ